MDPQFTRFSEQKQSVEVAVATTKRMRGPMIMAEQVGVIRIINLSFFAKVVG